eukprot:12405392-Karenia_brevis.AAC.1
MGPPTGFNIRGAAVGIEPWPRPGLSPRARIAGSWSTSWIGGTGIRPTNHEVQRPTGPRDVCDELMTTMTMIMMMIMMMRWQR